MIQILMTGIRKAGKKFLDARKESDGVKPSYRPASREYRAALPAVCKLLLVAILLNVFPVRGQTIEAITVGKHIEHVQTSATAVNVDPTPQGPDYGGAYGFSANVEGQNISSISAPIISGPIYVGEPFYNQGRLLYNTTDGRWRMGAPNANDWGSPTLSDLNSNFGSGTYTVIVNGVPISLNLTGDTYPNIPLLTLGGGTWSNGKYIIDPSQPLTITTNAFTAYGTHQNDWIGIYIKDSTDKEQDATTVPGTNFLSYTLPANTFSGGQEYIIGASFIAGVDLNPNPAFPGSTNVAFYEMSTRVTISTTNPSSGYVSQGGLTWSPASSTIYHYADAAAYCSNATFKGLSGWRLPTLTELTGLTTPPSVLTIAPGGLYASGAINGQGWTATLVWSSTPTTLGSTGNYPGFWGVFLADSTNPTYPFMSGSVINSAPEDDGGVTCVNSTPYNLSVAKSGSGTITSTPANISCGATCSGSYAPGTAITLTATPASGSYFAGWSGDCSGTGSCVVTMSAARNVTATFKPVPFVATTTSNVTATSATISTHIAFNVADMGQQGSVFVTAWVPVNGLGALGISTVLSSALRVTSTQDNPYTSKSVRVIMAPLSATDSSSFVMIQLTSSGWQLVVDGQLIPYASGVMGEQLAAQSILSNTNPAALVGAQFCLGYGTSAEEMAEEGRMLPLGTLTDQNTFNTSSGSCNVTQNHSDSWWNANESGWGITITDHGTNAFVQWYTYDQSGHNQKYVISGGTFSNDKCQFSGNITHVTGPSWTLPTFDPNLVTRTTVGSGSFDFCPPDLPAGTIVFKYTADGISGSKQLTRLPFGNDVPRQGGNANTGVSDFTDLWWNPAESGWGVSVTQHGDNLFFRVFAYDTDNKPLLFVVPGVTFNSATSFTGNLVLTSGPWFGSTPFDPSQVVRTTAGTATLTFTDANNGVLTYTVNGVTVTKAITRLEF